MGSGRRLLDAALADGGVTLDTLTELHRLLIAEVSPERAGRLRTSWAVIVLDGRTHLAAPPPARAVEDVKDLLAWLTATLLGPSGGDVRSVAAEVIARIGEAHPFTDGNGRLGIGLAQWILERGGYSRLPGTDLDGWLRGDRRRLYLALREYHRGDPDPWHELFEAATARTFEAHG